ncbi:MAG: Holliday junction branch migration DNA helicase RuvB [Treponema sp.]|nr:Holliday junction branch migration DNA helicase RuvB [Treponema sp.]MCL2252396.1 Holliday junction branch migration DNA helicase RuvB [Treponema sp.]
MDKKDISLVRPENIKEDTQDVALRPRTLKEFLGQKGMKENLNIFITAAKERGDSLDHVFLIGPAGLGKTTMAQIIANEMGSGFVQTTAPALEKPKDLVGFLTNLKKGDVFFIDEIHSLKPAIEELLYIAMEDYGIDWVVGQGPMARTIRIAIKPFTLVGATTKAGVVSGPLINRFGITCRFSFYEQEDLKAIVHRSAGLLNIKIEDDAACLLAKSSRGTPRVVNQLLKRMRDFAQVSYGSKEPKGSPSITMDVVRTGLERLEIDELGLEKQDREILKIIIERYKGGPVGAENLAITIGESVETLEDYYEPYLIQAGLLQRTPRGRVVTSFTYGHLGITPNAFNSSENIEKNPNDISQGILFQ